MALPRPNRTPYVRPSAYLSAKSTIEEFDAMADIPIHRTTTVPERTTSGWAIGWIFFAATMMILIGIFHVIAGLVAIFDDTFYVATRNYVFQFDATQWGWIHLVVGILVAVSGGYLLTGSVVARTVGVIMALISAVAGFAWLPYYPVWGVVMVAIAVSVIWALTAHGRDITDEVG
jgi:hypothetical protein